MSHFFTIVIVNPEVEDIESEVARLLAPYDENIKVEPYETDCWCVGRKAYLESCKIADKKYQSLNEIQKKFWNEFWTDERKKEALENPDILEVADRKWENFPARCEWERVREHAEKEHPLYQKPDPECRDCGGTGKRTTTYNPQAKWDWWVIGGRYNGLVGNGSANPNTAPVSVLLEKGVIPFAIITPDGKWHERGEMGWFGIVSNEKEEDVWTKEVRSIFEKHQDCLAVGCDLHI